MVDAGSRAGEDPPLSVDTLIGDFRVRGLLGEGAMGQVYLAQDTRLGRRVALKLVRRSVLERGGLERFLEEARATASFNHPNIVTLHAFGEHDGCPYLALEYLDGETLRQRIAGGPLPLRMALRYGRAIAEAIAEAHKRGIVHADLKPENVVIPLDGRLRVVDFGLARIVGDAPDHASGTPAYMAPERWRAQTPTRAIDVWSFGVMLHELVVGRRPLADAALARAAFSRTPVEVALPDAPWAGLVRGCLAWEPADRPTADELVRQLDELIDPRAVVAAERCPFPGLAAFGRDNAADYFGRTAELDTVVERLRTRPLVPIVGPSGIGKSSFVKAAVVPRLEEAGAWTVVELRPGPAPFLALASALADEQSSDDVARSLRDHPDRLALLLAARAARTHGRVLLVIDQFEEVFTLAAAEADAIAFCDTLSRAALADEPWRTMITVRGDFLGRVAATQIRTHLDAILSLGPLSTADLRAAVLRPLANAGFEPDEPDLVARIVADVEGQPACLPLLQFTCAALWERRDGAARKILASQYDAIGKAGGALAAHADRFMSELVGDQSRIARSILLSLVNVDGTRRPRSEAELLEPLPDGARTVLERLLERRLVVATRDSEHDAARIEVAHEALATAWPRLARWLDETHEERLLVTELEQAARGWQRRGRNDDETWAGVALAEAVRKVEAWNINLPSTSQSFLDAGRLRDRKTRRRRRWLFGVAAAVLTVVAVAGTIAAIAFAAKEREAVENRESLLLAAADMGEFDLELEPFDWDASQQRRVTPHEHPTLTWKLLTVDAQDQPGQPYREPDDLHRGVPRWVGTNLVERVESRSNPVFLEVERGPCRPSVLFLKRLPGFGERGSHRVIHVSVPTCDATHVDTIDIPAGGFIANHRTPDDTTFDVHVNLPAFSIDRTEVTRAAFAIYGGMKALTGDGAAPTSPYEDRNPDHDRLPVVGVNYFTARAYCRYLGKALPSVDQWQKAFRGGLQLADGPNPLPDRLRPWLPFLVGASANVESELRPVATSPVDVSPYGLVDLAGNVSEWTDDLSIATDERGLRTVLGANWDTPAERGHDLVTWQNARADQYLNYTIGIRCVTH